MIVRMLEDDPRMKLSKGDVLKVRPSGWDDEKVEVIERVSDGFDPECNLYRHQVEIATEEPTDG